MMQKRGALVILMLMFVWAAQAYDFSATVASGQMLYFNVVEGGVEVTHPCDQTGYVNAWKGFTKPTGALTIPTFVSYDDTTYAVKAVGAVAFYGCNALTKVTVQEGVAELDDYAFTGCTAVTEVHLPSTIASMGNQALANMTSLTGIWIAATEPPATHTYTFYETPIEDVALHVECSAQDSYAATAPWSGFDTVMSTGCKVTVTAVAGNDAYGTVSGGGTYDAGTVVTLVATPNAGCHFVCWNDADTANPRIVTVVKDTLFTAVFAVSAQDTVSHPDTVYVTVYDTIHLADTVYLTVPVHDTLAVHDTVYYAVPTSDTVYLPDTVFVSVPVHDTVMLVDTVYYAMEVHDTLVVHDTLTPTFFNVKVQSDNPALGVGVGTALLPAGVVAEVCGLPLEGGRFVSWDDGSTENPRKLTVTGTTTMTALFEKLNVTNAEKTAWTVAVDGLRLMLSGIDGQVVRLYDMQGRKMMEQPQAQETMTIDLLASGVYLLQVGNGPARRIVVKQ